MRKITIDGIIRLCRGNSMTKPQGSLHTAAAAMARQSSGAKQAADRERRIHICNRHVSNSGIQVWQYVTMVVSHIIMLLQVPFVRQMQHVLAAN